MNNFSCETEKPIPPVPHAAKPRHRAGYSMVQVIFDLYQTYTNLYQRAPARKEAAIEKGGKQCTC